LGSCSELNEFANERDSYRGNLDKDVGVGCLGSRGGSVGLLEPHFGAAISNFIDFGQKVGNCHITTRRLRQTNPLSRNLESNPENGRHRWYCAKCQMVEVY
jgi:hypothetical protein